MGQAGTVPSSVERTAERNQMSINQGMRCFSSAVSSFGDDLVLLRRNSYVVLVVLGVLVPDSMNGRPRETKEM